MEHEHTYDAQGKRTCCNQTEKVYKNAGAGYNVGNAGDNSSDASDNVYDHEHQHDTALSGPALAKLFAPAVVSMLLLLAAIVMDNWVEVSWFKGLNRQLWYVVSYLIVGLPVITDAVKSICKGEVFSEFLLMSIATLGAFYIEEYPEGVAVMLFYAVGEAFQTLAVSRAKGNIKALLDQRPDEVTILVNGVGKIVKAERVNIGDTMRLKAGEKVGLDGELLSEKGTFNTSALTGESKPDSKANGETVLAGMVNLNTPVDIRVTAAYSDSKLSKILDLVQHATSQKAPTELFIRKFAKVYTPIVVFLAIGICLLPYFFVSPYEFDTWLYRALVFLVISCPCALVISIPLGYFGGIGAASREGILFKGSNFLDVMANVKHIVMDKTGTMTEGVFEVQDVSVSAKFDKERILNMVNVLEMMSSHPVATAVHKYVGERDKTIEIKEAQEIAGLGLKAMVDGKLLLVGNFKLLDKFGIKYDIDPAEIVYTVIAVAYDNTFAGYLTIADKIKDTAGQTINRLNKLGIKSTMLSGDKSTVVAFVARQLHISNAYGDLLPEDKVMHLKEIKRVDQPAAFVGDGINDAPVVALSDVGIAMGGLGSDATIETADVVIQDDNPYKIPIAVMIGKKTKQIVWQNIALAFVVKAIVLILGAGGLATMWEAVFADVGVSLIAILNAVRIQRMHFK